MKSGFPIALSRFLSWARTISRENPLYLSVLRPKVLINVSLINIQEDVYIFPQFHKMGLMMYEKSNIRIYAVQLYTVAVGIQIYRIH